MGNITTSKCPETDRILSKYKKNKPCDCYYYLYAYISPCSHFIKPVNVVLSESHLNWSPEDFKILMDLWINQHSYFYIDKWWKTLNTTNVDVIYPNVITNLSELKKVLRTRYEKKLRNDIRELEERLFIVKKTLKEIKEIKEIVKND